MKETKHFVDLGLPSGTLWSSSTEKFCFTYNDAIKKYNGKLPTEQQFYELINNCKWEWRGDGYAVFGTNGNQIFITGTSERKVFGWYWSASQRDNNSINTHEGVCLFFNPTKQQIYNYYSLFPMSIILVENKKQYH